MDRRSFLGNCAGASAAFAETQAATNRGEQKLSQYVVVELMGYKRLVGRLSQAPVPELMQLDVPVEGGFVTQFINPKSVYRMTITDEKTVLELAKNTDPLPALQIEAPTMHIQDSYPSGLYEEEDEY